MRIRIHGDDITALLGLLVLLLVAAAPQAQADAKPKACATAGDVVIQLRPGP